MFNSTAVRELPLEIPVARVGPLRGLQSLAVVRARMVRTVFVQDPERFPQLVDSITEVVALREEPHEGWVHRGYTQAVSSKYALSLVIYLIYRCL